jgi:hypothetical protein
MSVILEGYNVMVNSEELVGTTACLDITYKCHINQCRNNCFWLYLVLCKTGDFHAAGVEVSGLMGCYSV